MTTVVCYCRQDDGTEQEPLDSTVFTKHGAIDFSVQVQHENSSDWIEVTSVTNNKLVKRSFTFPRQRCGRVQIHVTKAASDSGPALVGLEAFNQ